MQLDDIHCAHCQSRAIDHAANIAVERNVIELPLRCMGFALILLGRVMHGLELRLPIQRIRVHYHLGIEAMQIAVIGNHQRVDLDQR